ncbi:hypothetical protein ACFV0H_33005 [Streptomyces erythrochromogenes]|uniref:Uncharacterized protein n=1 Tax=Streptomyces erythrochromogenes TaxID=285574 RepID=A0ABZ1Q3C7_9ACTN|nr:hypothetical protein [Streptomyces erythrochromogenes]MCX5583977.1 hypothetical protein [Streptomyces erythrochromogenes]
MRNDLHPPPALSRCTRSSAWQRLVTWSARSSRTTSTDWARVGFEEQFMRRYDQRIPPVTFHPGSKALS